MKSYIVYDNEGKMEEFSSREALIEKLSSAGEYHVTTKDDIIGAQKDEIAALESELKDMAGTIASYHDNYLKFIKSCNSLIANMQLRVNKLKDVTCQAD